MATKTVTAVGDAQISTAQKVFGTGSGLFDGTGDKLTTPDNTAWEFGTGNFTIDCWIRFASGTTTNVTYVACGQNTDGSNFWTFKVYLNGASSIIGFDSFTGGAADIVLNDTCTLATETWYHIAITRSGSTDDTANWHVFLNGTKLTNTKAAGSYAATVNNSTGTLNVASNDGNTGNNFPGWIDEFRIVKGTAVWTSSFTPPTEPYYGNSAVGTELLLHMDGTNGSTDFIDSSMTTAPAGNFFQFF